jgi:hypothetical protein
VLCSLILHAGLLGFRTALQDFPVHFQCQRFNAYTQLFHTFSQCGVLVEERKKLCGLLGREYLALLAGRRQGFPMLRVGVRMRLVSIRLPCLRKQDEGRCVGSLETEREIQQDERIEVKPGDAPDIEPNPDRHYDRLGHQKDRGAKKPREGFGLQREQSSPKTAARGR